MEFKDYKEKQKFFKDKQKEHKQLWVSTMSNDTKNKALKVKNNLLIKGRTYIKPKESE